MHTENIQIQEREKWTDWKKGHENMRYQWSMTIFY